MLNVTEVLERREWLTPTQAAGAGLGVVGGSIMARHWDRLPSVFSAYDLKGLDDLASPLQQQNL